MLAIIHVVVGLITYFVYDPAMGSIYLFASAGYSAGAFLIIFNLPKGGLVLIAFFHFLDFGMMLYYGVFMLLFTCLMAEAAAFLIILDVWKGYATDTDVPPPEVDLVKKKKADPLGFDSNYYYNRYYDQLEGKERAPSKRTGVRPQSQQPRRKANFKKRKPAPKVPDRDRAGR